jgi:hypothetical protein
MIVNVGVDMVGSRADQKSSGESSRIGRRFRDRVFTERNSILREEAAREI